MTYADSGLIGRDIKARRKYRVRRNRSNRKLIGRWMIPAVVIVATLGLFLLAGAR